MRRSAYYGHRWRPLGFAATFFCKGKRIADVDIVSFQVPFWRWRYSRGKDIHRRLVATLATDASSGVSRNKTDSSELFSIFDHLGELDQIPLEDVRNWSIIAHVDHGKSSLASRVLEYVGNLGEESQQFALQLASAKSNGTAIVAKDKAKKEQIQLLDTLAVEQQRGITVKASAASMLYRHSSAKGPLKCLLLNMVDTPGHGKCVNCKFL